MERVHLVRTVSAVMMAVSCKESCAEEKTGEFLRKAMLEAYFLMPRNLVRGSSKVTPGA